MATKMIVNKSDLYFKLDCLIDFLKSVITDPVLLKYLENRTIKVDSIYSLDNLLIYKKNNNETSVWSETNRLLHVYLMNKLNLIWYAYPKNTFTKLPDSENFTKNSVISYLSKYEKDIKKDLNKDSVILEKRDNFIIYFGSSFLCYLHIAGNIIIKYEDILCSGISHNKDDDYLVIHVKTVNENTKLNHKYLLLITGIDKSMRDQMIKLLW